MLKLLRKTVESSELVASMSERHRALLDLSLLYFFLAPENHKYPVLADTIDINSQQWDILLTDIAGCEICLAFDEVDDPVLIILRIGEVDDDVLGLNQIPN